MKTKPKIFKCGWFWVLAIPDDPWIMFKTWKQCIWKLQSRKSQTWID